MEKIDELEAKIEDLRAQLHSVSKGDEMKLKAAGFRLGSMRIYEDVAGILRSSGKITCHYGTAAERAASTDYKESVFWWESDNEDLYMGTGAAWQVIGGASGAAPGTHHATHQHSGADEVATATPGANVIPKAGADSKLAAGFLQEVLAYADLTDDPYADHSARHENTGADEISVTGLSGLLADDQHVLDAEAIAAVEGEATLDLGGDVTIDGAKSLSVDVINEKDAAAGITLDLLTLIKDAKITPHTTYPDAFLQAAAAATTLGLDANDYFIFARSGNTWSLYLANVSRFQVSPTAAAVSVPFTMVDGGTISPTKSLKADTIAETTGAAGVTADGLLLKDGYAGLAKIGEGNVATPASGVASLFYEETGGGVSGAKTLMTLGVADQQASTTKKLRCKSSTGAVTDVATLS